MLLNLNKRLKKFNKRNQRKRFEVKNISGQCSIVLVKATQLTNCISITKNFYQAVIQTDTQFEVPYEIIFGDQVNLTDFLGF